MKKFEIKTNVHPNTDGSPWGWVIIEGSGIRVATWSGKEERKLCEELCKSHNSQFSIGGEKALRDRLKLFEAADGNQLLTESEIDLIAESLTKEGYLAAYSGEGIRQWISVDKELPKIAGTYIVYDKHDSHVTTNYYSLKNSKWMNISTPDDITHWMPLPEPPK